MEVRAQPFVFGVLGPTRLNDVEVEQLKLLCDDGDQTKETLRCVCAALPQLWLSLIPRALLLFERSTPLPPHVLPTSRLASPPPRSLRNACALSW